MMIKTSIAAIILVGCLSVVQAQTQDIVVAYNEPTTYTTKAFLADLEYTSIYVFLVKANGSETFYDVFQVEATRPEGGGMIIEPISVNGTKGYKRILLYATATLLTGNESVPSGSSFFSLPPPGKRK